MAKNVLTAHGGGNAHLALTTRLMFRADGTQQPFHDPVNWR